MMWPPLNSARVAEMSLLLTAARALQSAVIAQGGLSSASRRRRSPYGQKNFRRLTLTSEVRVWTKALERAESFGSARNERESNDHGASPNL